MKSPEEMLALLDEQLITGQISETLYRELRARQEARLGPRLDPFETEVVERFPQPIAAPFRALVEAEDVIRRAKLFVDVLTNVLKYVALVVESDYLHSDLRLDGVNAIIDQHLGRPLVSTWDRFLRAALPAMEAEGHAFFVSEIPGFYARVQTDVPPRERVRAERGYYDEAGDFVQTTGTLAWIEALLHYRNRFAHGFNASDEVMREGLDRYVPLLRRVLEEMAWCTRYPLLKYENGRLLRLAGQEPAPFDPAAPEPPRLGSNLALASPDGARFLPLVPLFIVPSEFVPDDEHGLDLLLYDQSTGKRIVYVSPRGHQRETAATIRHWRRLVEARRVVLPVLGGEAITPEAVAERSARITRESRESLVASRKLVVGSYWPRPEYEAPLRAWPGSVYPLLMVASPAGGGKTSLLAHMAKVWQDEGASVLLLRAAQIEERDVVAALCARLRIAPDVEPATLAARGASPERPWLVILDGINEHPHRVSLLRSVVALAEATRGERSFGVIVSLRSEDAAWAETGPRARALFFPPATAAPATLDTRSDTSPETPPADSADAVSAPPDASDAPPAAVPPAVHLAPLSPADVEGMWASYANRDARRFSPRFSYADLEARSRDIASLLRNPLLLRLFLEVFATRAMPASLSREGIFDAYLDRLGERTRDDNSFLFALGRLCLATGAATIDIDTLYDDAAIGPIVRRTDIGSPYLRLLRAGVLEERREEGRVLVGFVVEAVFEYVLGRALLDDGAAGTGKALAETLAARPEHSSLRGAVRTALALRVQESGLPFLLQFVDAAEEGGVAEAGPVLARLLVDGAAPDELARGLVNRVTVNDLHVACAAAEYLRDELRYGPARDLLRAVHAALGARLDRHLARRDLLLLLSRVEEDSGDFEAALETAQTALAWAAEGEGEEPESEARGHARVGWLQGRLSRFAPAIEHLERALEIRRVALGDGDPATAGSEHDLGVALQRIGRYEEARVHLEHALETRMRVFGRVHPKVATSHATLGMTFAQLARYDEELVHKREALAIRLQLFGPNHPDVAAARSTLAWGLKHRSDFEGARREQDEALRVQRAILGERHPVVANTMSDIGVTLHEQGDFSGALDMHRDALAIRSETLGPRHVLAAVSHDAIARPLERLGRDDEALSHKQTALAIAEEVYGPDSLRLGMYLNSLAWAHSRAGRHEEARPLQERALALRERHLSPEHPAIAASLADLGITLGRTGDLDGALLYKERALAIQLAARGEEHPVVGTAYNNLGVTLGNLGRHEEARTAKEKSLAIRRRTLGEAHPDTAASHHNLGVTLGRLGDHEGALACKERALAIREVALGATHKSIAVSCRSIAKTLESLDQPERAAAFRERARAVKAARERQAGTNEPPGPSR